MKISLLGIAIVCIAVGYAEAQTIETVAARLRLDELVALSRQGVSDEALIAQIEQRGVAFALTQQDFQQQCTTGISEGLLRYLQGRSHIQQGIEALIVNGQYGVPVYSGLLYHGPPYLGSHGGYHDYGSSTGHNGSASGTTFGGSVTSHERHHYGTHH